MSTAEIKEEMHRVVDNIPETALIEALAFLKKATNPFTGKNEAR